MMPIIVARWTSSSIIGIIVGITREAWGGFSFKMISYFSRAYQNHVEGKLGEKVEE